MTNVNSNYIWHKIITELLSGRNRVKVKSDFHGQVCQIDNLLDNDQTGLVSTVYEFMVETANVDFKFESGNENLDKRLQLWATTLNSGVNIDIPSGLASLTTQYLRERWRSSFIALNISWKKKDGYVLPNRMWFTDGKQIYVDGDTNKLNGYKYYVGKGEDKKPLLSTDKKTVIIRKPYESWYEKYPTPYFVHKGALYNALVKNELIAKQADLIDTIIPHILLAKAGNDVFAKREEMPTEPELEELKTKIKDMSNDQKNSSDQGQNIGAFPYDVTLENLIPDLTKFLNEDIVKPFDKNLLSALGLVEMEGFSKSRQETILNPKILVEEINDAVEDWTRMLEEVLMLIVEKNKTAHPKDANKMMRVVPGIVKAFITDAMRVMLRSLFDRGTIGHQDLLEATTRLDAENAFGRRKREREELDEILSPHIIQISEKQDNDPDVKETPEQTTKENTPEKKKSEKDIETSEIEDITQLPRMKKIVMENVEGKFKTIDDLPQKIKDVLTIAEQIKFVMGKDLS